MPGYAKLFASIVHSTIWREENHVRLVWITMLAIADKNGFVEASVPGLADISRVEMSMCQAALDHLASPDEYSRSQDYDGRRIEPMDGGWLLLNYTKYRGALLEDKIREQNRVRQMRFRASKQGDSNAKVTGNAKITSHNAGNAQSDPDPDPDPDPSPSPDPTSDLKTKITGSANSPASKKTKRVKKANNREAKSTATWNAYSAAYGLKYGTDAKRNAKANTHCCELVDRLGAIEAPLVAAFYLSVRNSYHVSRGHSLQCLVGDAEKIRTEWATGRQVTQAEAREGDRLEKSRSGWQKIIDERGEPG